MMISGKVKAAAAAVALFSVLGLAGCGESGKPAASTAAAKVDNVKVKVGYSPSLCQAPIFVAYEKGYFKDAGLDPELVKVDGATANESLGSGKVDMEITLVSKTIHPLQNGLPVKGTTGVHFGCVRAITRPDSGIKDVKDLKGKRIGVAGLADTGTVIIQRALKHEGIGVTPDNMEVEFVVVDRNSLPQALSSGQVDAIVMTDPVGYIAQKEYGYVPVLDTATSKGWKDEYCCDLVVTNQFIEKNQAAAKALTEAIQKGSLYIKQHPEEAAKMLIEKKYVNGDEKEYAELLKSYNYTPSVQGGYYAIKAAAKDLSDLGLVNQLDAKEFADNAYYFFDGYQDVKSL